MIKDVWLWIVAKISQGWLGDDHGLTITLKRDTIFVSYNFYNGKKKLKMGNVLRLVDRDNWLIARHFFFLPRSKKNLGKTQPVFWLAGKNKVIST